MQGVRIYNDAMVKGTDKEKTIEIIARYAKVKPEIVRDSFPAAMDPNQRVSLAFLEELQAFFLKEKFLHDEVTSRA